MGVNVSKTKTGLDSYPSLSPNVRRSRRNTQSNIEVVRSLHQSLEKNVGHRRPSGRSNKFFQANKRTGRRPAISQESPLTREYNAWLRSLATNLDEDASPHSSSASLGSRRKDSGGWYSTIRKKVNSLMRSKRHRESSIVWPEMSSTSVQQMQAPKVRLSFAPDKAYVKELRKQVINSHKRRSIADFNAKNDEFDPAAFYMEHSFQCTDTGPKVSRRTSKSIESIQSAMRVEPLKRHSMQVDRLSAPNKRHDDRKASIDELKTNKYQWDVAYDPYGGIQGTSCVMGPKVLPTSNETWKNIATSSSNLSKSSKSSSDVLDELPNDSMALNYSSFYGNDVLISGKKSGSGKAKKTRDHAHSEQSFDIFPTPKSEKSTGSRKKLDVQRENLSGRDIIEYRVDPEEDVKKPKWQRFQYDPHVVYDSIDLGPGGENFMLGDTHDSNVDEGIVTKGSFSSNELAVPGAGTLPRTRVSPSPQLLWKTDSKMASSLKSLKDHQSPYHQMPHHHRHSKRHNVGANSRSFSSNDDFYSDWDEDHMDSPTPHRRSKRSGGYNSDYDSYRRAPSNASLRRREQYLYRSGDRREMVQQTRMAASSRNSNAMDQGLEGKIDNMVKSLIQDNQMQLQSRRNKKQRPSRNYSASSSTGGDATQSYLREMIEAKLATALTSALVPNHPDNRNLYK